WRAYIARWPTPHSASPVATIAIPPRRRLSNAASTHERRECSWRTPPPLACGIILTATAWMEGVPVLAPPVRRIARALFTGDRAAELTIEVDQTRSARRICRVAHKSTDDHVRAEVLRIVDVADDCSDRVAIDWHAFPVLVP